MDDRVLVISPVRNEAAHIQRVVRAVAAQERPPDRWVIVDDSSTDGTLELLRALEPEFSFMTVIEAGDMQHAGARDRLACAVDAHNFNAALSTVNWRDYTHIMKLDGDIELPPRYLGVLLERFASDHGLGLAGGVIEEPTPDGGARRIRIPRNHVHGALKCYSRDCLEAIGGVQERLAWDTIDETYARMRGFETVSFEDLVAVHHRPLASADGVLRGRARHGECAYISHYPPLWVVLRSVKVARSAPQGFSGVAFLFGYVRAAMRRTPRVNDAAYRCFTRRELRRRLLEMAYRAASSAVRRLRATAPTV